MTDPELCEELRFAGETGAADRIEDLAAQVATYRAAAGDDAIRIAGLEAERDHYRQSVGALKAELLAAQNQIGDLCWDAGCASVRHQRLADLADALVEMWRDERRRTREDLPLRQRPLR